MAKFQLVKGTTNYPLYIFIQDSSSTTGAGLTGLLFNSASLVASHLRPLAARVAITLVTQTVTGAYSSGGFVEVDATNMPGIYRFDPPNTTLATGVDSVVVTLKGATNMAQLNLEIQLTGTDVNDATGGGISRIDAAITSRLAPTTASRTLDVAATGEAGMDLGNVTGVLGNASVSWVDGSDQITLLTATQASIDAIEADTADMQPKFGVIATLGTGANIGANLQDIAGTGFVTSTDSLEAIRNTHTDNTSGTSDSGTTTTMVDAVRTEGDDYWNGGWIRFTSGTLNNVTRLITGFVSAGTTITFAPAAPAAVSTHTYEILPAAYVAQAIDNYTRLGAPSGANVAADIIALKAETALIVADTNELQTDNVPGLIATAQADLDIITGVDGVILLSGTQASIDAIKSDTNELQTDNVPGLIATAQADLDIITGASGVNLLTATQASIDATEADTNELQTDWANGGRLDLILDAGSRTVQMTEGYAADGVAPTMEQAVFLIQQQVTEFVITGTTYTTKKLDGSTTAATFTLDDATTPTSMTRAT